ncbi:replication initiation protein [Aureispira anguillae]|uniref:Replication initiation protein n=1 Tax=Aureispira anguillae TaxID=2864201 RepID=A0A915YM54_9BACT|nr:replication initiation protein [Aureispira anguillae]BDS15653.1 replication initiation protein [Aureispira anguillae]
MKIPAQLVKKKDIKDKNVAKAQPLVEAAYNFSIWEKRVYTILASLVDKKDPDFKSYRINIRDIIDFYECKSHDAYDRIREVPESLLTKNKIIKIPYTTEEGHRRILKTHLITAVTEPAEDDNSAGNGYIELEFHPRLKPFLLGLKRYLCYDIKNTIGISSVHTLRIFEFLKLHQYKKQHQITVHDLKVMLGLEEKHKKYGHFKRVIVKAQKDIKKHTDIRFEFDEIKQGRAVYALNFKIYDNGNVKATTSAMIEAEVTNVGNGYELFLIIRDWGITKETFNEFVRNYSIQHIKERIEYIQNAPKNNQIKNRAGYLRKLLEQPTLFDESKIKKQTHVITKRKKAAQAKNKAKLKEQLVELKRLLNAAENEQIDIFFQDHPAEKLAIIQQTKASGLAKNKFDNLLSDEENFSDNPRFQLFVYAEAKKTYPELLTEVRSTYLPQIEALKKIA